jgi:NADP-dependent 3-hydroxy acid dehydrogenase YdfG
VTVEWVLITGASRGIGAGAAERLAAAGFNLVLWARSATDLQSVAGRCEAAGASVRWAAVDVADPESVNRAGLDSLSGIDSLRGCVLNAGGATFGPLSEFTAEAWRSVIASNLDGAFFTLKAALPLLERRRFSQLVSMGSQSALFAFETQAGYCASKAGLSALMETVRREKRAAGVRVTSLIMSGVDTYFRGKKPGDRPGSLVIDDVAKVVEYLFTLPESVEVRELQLSSMLNPFGPFPERVMNP